VCPHGVASVLPTLFEAMLAQKWQTNEGACKMVQVCRHGSSAAGAAAAVGELARGCSHGRLAHALLRCVDGAAPSHRLGQRVFKLAHCPICSLYCLAPF
jgi:hypothetical protein